LSRFPHPPLELLEVAVDDELLEDELVDDELVDDELADEEVVDDELVLLAVLEVLEAADEPVDDDDAPPVPSEHWQGKRCMPSLPQTCTLDVPPGQAHATWAPAMHDAPPPEPVAALELAFTAP
jgi:hypothetical protein